MVYSTSPLHRSIPYVVRLHAPCMVCRRLVGIWGGYGAIYTCAASEAEDLLHFPDLEIDGSKLYLQRFPLTS